MLRDVLTKEFDGAVIDDPKQHHRVTSFFQRTAPELVEFVELYEGAEPLLEREGAAEAFDQVLTRRADLPSGGYLMIDYAEALTVIDVNTGSFTGRGKGRLEDTITKVNVEAADEVVRQLRLRDIGGIIVIDFIDMAKAKNRDQVLKTLKKALDADKTKSYVMEVSPLGLVEMTRQNVTDGVREILTQRCPTCDGEGVVRSAETMAIEVLRKLRELAADEPKPEAFLIRVNPNVAAELVAEDSGLVELEEETGKHFHFEGGEALAIETYEVVDRGSRDEIEERALPFRVGEEVLVTIEEPHMYNADDAIARVDSYIVSVSGGGASRRRAAAGRDRERRPVGGHRGAPGRERTSREARIACSLRKAPRPTRRSAAQPGPQRERLGRRGLRTMAETYAIVESGGKQYRAEKGTTLVVDRLRADEGAKVNLRAVMFRGDEDVVARRRQAREGQGRGHRRRATSAARRSACSSTGPRRASASAPGTARS